MEPFADLTAPIVLAPLAGGPSTVELARAVSDAGGLGFLAAGYRSAEDVGEQVARLRAATTRPFGVGVFAPSGPRAGTGGTRSGDVPGDVASGTGSGAAPDDAATARAADARSTLDDYAVRIRAEADRFGVAVGSPPTGAEPDDDGWDAKVALLLDLRVPVVSFVFGCPPAETIGRFRDAGTSVWVTVTTPAEARVAADSGADALVVQGVEAGGHRGTFLEPDSPGYGLLSLLQLVRSEVELPLVAAGGIATGRGLAAVLAAGARAAQLGTAFLRTPEAGTAQVHREAVAGTGETALTRAFTGKPARGIVNRFMREHEDAAPSAYPGVHHLTAPLRAAGRAAGDGDVVNLWAGEAHALARKEPAAEVVRRLVAEARAAAREGAGRLGE